MASRRQKINSKDESLPQIENKNGKGRKSNNRPPPPWIYEREPIGQRNPIITNLQRSFSFASKNEHRSQNRSENASERGKTRQPDLSFLPIRRNISGAVQNEQESPSFDRSHSAFDLQSQLWIIGKSQPNPPGSRSTLVLKTPEDFQSETPHSEEQQSFFSGSQEKPSSSSGIGLSSIHNSRDFSRPSSVSTCHSLHSFASNDGVRSSLTQENNRSSNYKMDHDERGHFIIFNFNVQGKHPRAGAANDTKSLERCFGRCLGFKVHVYENASTMEVTETLKYFTMDENHTDFDCFGIAVLGHGSEGFVHTQDGLISIDHITDQICSCITLEGKPKVILVQACRMISQNTFRSIETDAKPFWTPNIPHGSDLLLSYATTKGKEAFRIPTCGSPYIQILTQYLEARGDQDSILDILTDVNAGVQKTTDRYGKSQGTVFESSLTKKLKFDRIVGGMFRKFADGRFEPID